MSRTLPSSMPNSSGSSAVSEERTRMMCGDPKQTVKALCAAMSRSDVETSAWISSPSTRQTNRWQPLKNVYCSVVIQSAPQQMQGEPCLSCLFLPCQSGVAFSYIHGFVSCNTKYRALYKTN